MKTLRGRLMLSHVLLVLITVPALSLYMLHMLQNLYTTNMVEQLAHDAYLLEHWIEDDWEVMGSQSVTTVFENSPHQTAARAVLLSPEATVLASSRDEDRARLGTRFSDPGVSQALSGQPAEGVGQGFNEEVAYAAVPVNHDGAVIGALRLSYELSYTRAVMRRIEWLVVGAAIVVAGIALVVGARLSASITGPLRRLGESVASMEAGDYKARVPVEGQDEVTALARCLNRTVEQLEKTEKLRQQQLAGVVHELVRPLAGMRTALETMQDGLEGHPGQYPDLLAGVVQEVERLERLLGRLQTINRYLLQPPPLQRGRVDLGPLIRGCLNSFGPIATQSGVRLNSAVPDGLPPVSADEDQLIQVFVNLLDNALKFTPAGGQVLIGAESREQELLISVSDTGSGIPSGHFPLLFRPFHSPDNGFPPEKQGLGLGLSICRAIVAAHSGRIWAENLPGGGARFMFTLPSAGDHARSPAPDFSKSLGRPPRQEGLPG